MFEAKQMRKPEASLRSIVEKWLMPTSIDRIQVERVSRAHDNQVRCVRVKAPHPGGPIALLFFQHHDGVWRVFPPGGPRLSVSVPESFL